MIIKEQLKVPNADETDYNVVYPENSAEMVKFSDTTLAAALENLEVGKIAHADYADAAESTEKDSAGNKITEYYLPIDNAAMTGTPTAPTVQDLDDNSTKLATTEFVADYIRRLLSADLATIETIYQLSVALNQDKNFSEAVVQALSEKLTQSQADSRYIQIGGHAGSATRDANGNVITETYATKNELGNVSVADASSTTKGVMKLYTGTGTATDGTMTQNAINAALSSKLGTSSPTVSNNILSFNGGTTGSSLQIGISSCELLCGNKSVLYYSGNTSSKSTSIYSPGGISLHLQDSDNSCRILASGGLYVNGTKLA